MKVFRNIPLWGLLIIILLAANLGWMAWNAHQNIDRRLAAKLYKVETLHTNGTSGVGIMDAKRDKPIWIKWGNKGKLALESFYFHGEHVLDMWSKSNRAPVYGLYFHHSGKELTLWLNHGGANTFTDRAFYTNGILSYDEVWWKKGWHKLVRQNGLNGVFINGRWRQLQRDTNGMWTVKATVVQAP